jgi:hypothetical protein
LRTQDREDNRQKINEANNDARQQRQLLQQQQTQLMQMQWQEAMILCLKEFQQQSIAMRQAPAITYNVQNNHNEQFSQSNNAQTSTALLNNFSALSTVNNNSHVLVDSRQQLALLGPQAQNAASLVQLSDLPLNLPAAASSSSSSSFSSSTAPGARRLAPRILGVNRLPAAMNATGAHENLQLEDRDQKRSRDERDATGTTL